MQHLLGLWCCHVDNMLVWVMFKHLMLGGGLAGRRTWVPASMVRSAPPPVWSLVRDEPRREWQSAVVTSLHGVSLRRDGMKVRYAGGLERSGEASESEEDGPEKRREGLSGRWNSGNFKPHYS